MGEFFGGIGAPPKAAGKVPDFVAEVSKKYSSIKTWGAVGVRNPFQFHDIPHHPVLTIDNHSFAGVAK